MNRTTAFFVSGTLVVALAMPCVVRAYDYDRYGSGSFAYDDEDRTEYLDRDINQDRAKIRNEQRDLRHDYRQLQEETREGDWAGAAAVRRDIERDQRQLRRDQNDVRRDFRERRDRDDDDD